MLKFAVALRFEGVTDLTASELVGRFGIAESALVLKETPDRRYWRYEPIDDPTATLSDLLDSLTAAIGIEGPIALDSRILGVAVRIAAYFDLAYCPVDFPARCLEGLLRKIPEIEVQIACYPCC